MLHIEHYIQPYQLYHECSLNYKILTTYSHPLMIAFVRVSMAWKAQRAMKIGRFLVICT